MRGASLKATVSSTTSCPLPECKRRVPQSRSSYETRIQTSILSLSIWPALFPLATQPCMLKWACSKAAPEKEKISPSRSRVVFEVSFMVAARVNGSSTLSEVDLGHFINRLHRTKRLDSSDKACQLAQQDATSLRRFFIPKIVSFTCRIMTPLQILGHFGLPTQFFHIVSQCSAIKLREKQSH